MPERKLSLNDPGRPKFDPTQIPEGGSFGRVNEDPPAEGFSQPPPATPDPSPGMQGQLPLPSGHIVSAASLTAHERKMLESVGWQPGKPIPGNLPEILAEVQQQARQESYDTQSMPPPGDPSQVPPLKMPAEQRLEEMSPQDQARIKAALAEAEQLAARGPQQFQPGGQGVGDAAAGVVHRQVDMGPTVADDRQSDAYASGEPKHRAPTPDATAETQQAAHQSQTALPQGGPKHCPHCSWDLAMPDPVEPTAADKQSFLGAILGSKPWQRSYELLDGKLSITFRQLTPDEVDLCYTQVYAERRKGKVDTMMDFWEQLTRYRSCLQLVDFRSGEDLVRFPTSIEEWGGATSSEATPLPQIMQQIRSEVVKTESLQRIVSTTAARFNRLAAKLEANIETPDFWEATESPT